MTGLRESKKTVQKKKKEKDVGVLKKTTGEKKTCSKEGAARGEKIDTGYLQWEKNKGGGG